MECDKDIITHLEKLLNEVVNVNSKFNLFKFIKERQNDSLKELNLAPAFFSLILDSLINNVIISIAKIYEPCTRSSGSMDKLFNKIEQNIKNISEKNIDNNIINKHRDYISNKKDIIYNLFIWRDKHFAHLDKSIF
ncbi:hypothetical protein [Clostridium estertheticum]|uniref:AbiU2 domain-containing protein n=1 Tax=Clostridium estertheticum TaxID=238834 RepID=UPI001C7DDC70|nr:hypothetical protein [Clostridium estertheticum]MBX4269092.1 hypothetical protein [Clostridium estertheticum]WLC80502.1 hypothetical protein KTC98_04005 [Clostridium estertheticum]